MKIKNIIDEGFWDSLAAGVGAHELAQSLQTHGERKERRAGREKARGQAQAALQVKPQPARTQRPAAPTALGFEPVEGGILVQPNERLDITLPTNPPSNYYKTTSGWFNALNQPVRSAKGIQQLEIAAEKGTGRISVNPPAPITQPAAPAKPLTPKQKLRLDTLAARQAATTTKTTTIPTPVYAPRAKAAAESVQEDDEPQVFRSQRAVKKAELNLDPVEKARMDKVRADYASRTGEFTPVFNLDKDDDSMGIWNESDDDREGKVMIDKAIKLINEYTVKEMAVRRLKKEKLEEENFTHNHAGQRVEVPNPGEPSIAEKYKFYKEKYEKGSKYKSHQDEYRIQMNKFARKLGLPTVPKFFSDKHIFHKLKKDK